MERDNSINYFKAILVIGMILGHCIQLLSKPTGLWGVFSQGINLITFSGFFFVFGYLYNLNYCDKQVSVNKKIKSIIFPLLAFYISAISWCVIIENSLTLKMLLKILLMIRIPPYSEFLLAYTVMSLLFWLIRPVLQKLRNSSVMVIILLLLILLLSFVPFYKLYPTIVFKGQEIYFDYYIGLLIGSNQHSYFPVFQYFTFFLIGVFFSQKGVVFSKIVLSIAFIGTVMFVCYCLLTKEYPSRFPPSFFWIVGSWFILYLYFLLSKKIKKNQFLNAIGENTMNYLLLSNIFIFSIRGPSDYSYTVAVLTGLLILVVIYFINFTVRKSKIFS